MKASSMRVCVCELPDTDDFAGVWAELLRTIASDAPQIVVLPELPFSAWFCGDADFNEKRWSVAVKRHEQFLIQVRRADAAIVYSMPASLPEGRRNLARITSARSD